MTQPKSTHICTTLAIEAHQRLKRAERAVDRARAELHARLASCELIDMAEYVHATEEKEENS